MSDTQLDYELTKLRDENVRLRAVIDKADDWRDTLYLPQQDLGCLEFNNAFAEYDDVRAEIEDLIPARPLPDDEDDHP